MPSRPAKGMFERVRRGDGRGLTAWGSGPRFIVLCFAAGTALAVATGQTKSSPDERKVAFERVAQLVNEPVRGLRPFHERIAAPGGGDMMLLDSRREACVEASAHVEKLTGLAFPPEAQGRATESAEGIRSAAARFLEGMGACRGGGDAAAPGPNAVPTCVLRCIRGWSSLVGSVEQLREDAAWLGVPVEALAPPGAKSSTR